MSLSATLKIGDNTSGNYDQVFHVVNCKYKFSCGYNYRLPDTEARNDSIEITLLSLEKEDVTLYDWYIKRMLVSGVIEFEFSTKTLSEKGKKTLFFENASCFSLSESYSIDGKSLRLVTIEIAAESTTVDAITFFNFNI